MSYQTRRHPFRTPDEKVLANVSNEEVSYLLGRSPGAHWRVRARRLEPWFGTMRKTGIEPATGVIPTEPDSAAFTNQPLAQKRSPASPTRTSNVWVTARCVTNYTIAGGKGRGAEPQAPEGIEPSSPEHEEEFYH